MLSTRIASGLRLTIQMGILLFATNLHPQTYQTDNQNADTLRVKKPVLFTELGATVQNELTQVKGQNLVFPHAQGNSPFRYLVPNASTPTLKFKKCFLGEDNTLLVAKMKEPVNTKRVEFDSCAWDWLNFYQQSNETAIYNTAIGGVLFDSCNNHFIRILSSSVKERIIINDCRNSKIQLHDLEWLQGADVRIAHSTVQDFSYMARKGRPAKIYFFRDSLNGFVSNLIAREDRVTPDPWVRDTLFFGECYINGDFWFSPDLNALTIIFNKCTFGPQTYLSPLAANEIQFTNCRLPETSILFSTDASQPTMISFFNTDITNLRMNFTSLMRVATDTSENRDQVNHSFINLLNKFRAEGKTESFQEVDLQYQQFSTTPLLFWIREYWWHHGYDKARVFKWTFLFFGIFFLINLRYWKSVHDTYPIIPGVGAGFYHRGWKKGRLAGTVLLYTLFVFFSIRVNMEKLNFSRYRGVVWFLFQYLVGLVCLLFILRYIFGM